MQDQESSLGRNLVQQHQKREKVEQQEQSKEEQRVEQSTCWMAQRPRYDDLSEEQTAQQVICCKAQKKIDVREQEMQQRVLENRLLAGTDEKHPQKKGERQEQTWTPAHVYMQGKEMQIEGGDGVIQRSRGIQPGSHG